MPEIFFYYLLLSDENILAYRSWPHYIQPTSIHQRKEVDLAMLGLLLSDENIHRHSVEVPLGTDFIFKETLIWFLYILWQVRKEEERRNACLVQLHAVLDLDIRTFC